MTEVEDDIEVDLDELREKAELEEVAEKHDLEPEVIDDHLDERLADKEYQEAQPEPRSLGERIREVAHILRTIFIPSSPISAWATVTDVGVNEKGIKLVLETDEARNSVVLDSGGNQINKVLQSADARKPSELRGEDIPVKPNRNHPYVAPHTPRNRHVLLPIYLWQRVLLRANAYNRWVREEFYYTRVFLLLNGVLTTAVCTLLTQVLSPQFLSESVATNDETRVALSNVLMMLGISPLVLYSIVVVFSFISLFLRVLFS